MWDKPNSMVNSKLLQSLLIYRGGDSTIFTFSHVELCGQDERISSSAEGQTNVL